MSAADVENLILLRSQTDVIVQPTEEQRDGRIVFEGLHPPVQRLLEVLGRHMITAKCLKAGCMFAHPLERCSGVLEMSAFPRQDVGGGFRHARYSDAGPASVGSEEPRYLVEGEKSMDFRQHPHRGVPARGRACS
jgi:hypothetical protein